MTTICSPPPPPSGNVVLSIVFLALVMFLASLWFIPRLFLAALIGTHLWERVVTTVCSPPPSGNMVLSIVFLAFVMLAISPSPGRLLISTHLQEQVIIGRRAEDAELLVAAGEEASISQMGKFPVLTTVVGVFTVEGKKLVWPSLNICWSDVFR